MKDFGICVTHRLVPPLVFGFRFQFNHWLLHNCVTHILHTPVGTGAQSPVNLWKSDLKYYKGTNMVKGMLERGMERYAPKKKLDTITEPSTEKTLAKSKSLL